RPVTNLPQGKTGPGRRRRPGITAQPLPECRKDSSRSQPVGPVPSRRRPSMGSRASVSLAGGSRLKSIDAVRGLAVALMALDHVRDFFLAENQRYSATDLDATR